MTALEPFPCTSLATAVDKLLQVTAAALFSRNGVYSIQHWERFRDVSQAGILAPFPQSHQPLSNIKQGRSSLLQDKGGREFALFFCLIFGILFALAQRVCARHAIYLLITWAC